jgi:hypothetical protein
MHKITNLKLQHIKGGGSGRWEVGFKQIEKKRN